MRRGKKTSPLGIVNRFVSQIFIRLIGVRLDIDKVSISLSGKRTSFANSAKVDVRS